jgi:hypothetical protein
MNKTYFETQEEKQLHDDAYYQAILVSGMIKRF